MATARAQRLLIAVTQVTTQREIAARLRCNRSAVAQWLNGYTTPSAEHRAMLWTIYRIPPNTWQLHTGRAR